ncbi:short chain dehydrogenase reductase [Colletotrichum truncatum]|uniref:Short chain dehydrogenase reductase n=1 Tax=Colletotrichum truncatum TaxID=5467 RepID=A0ACC3Z8N4_COLTU|nr:short chain dehydrogenase reductase [Colletotrichum truncatum]KAF6789267.1 short chain dehydrogenase reductase [Colletotrichum truncatum]
MVGPFQAGRLAVITGGASGIGLSLAQRCVTAGMHVIACDKDQKAIDRAKSTLGQGFQAIQMDVSQPDDWAALKAIVDKDHSGLVSLLALNAGIKPESSFENLSSFQTTFNTNVFGVVAGIDALLPGVKANAVAGYKSTVIITGSKQGITNPPGYPAYNASKAAVKSIAEQLSYDLRHTERVSVHLLVPGWAFTGMGNSNPIEKSQKPEGAWWPEQVVEYMEQKINQDQF